MTVYLYDNSGSPIGMQYHAATSDEYEWEIYWYEKNLAGDIVAIHTDTDVRLASYDYDAWGNTFVTYYYGAENSKVADNPFTYRGYYYDKDLNLYYLGTRYYDSATKRFVNADAMMSGTNGTLGGYNLFAYCFNNPIMFTDEGGNWPKWGNKLVALVVVATAVVTATVVTVATCGIGSVAGVTAITATATYTAKTLEVFQLQKEKSEDDVNYDGTNKTDDQIKEDVINAIFDNGLKITLNTTLFKSGGVAGKHLFNNNALVKETLKETGGKTISFISLGIEIYEVIRSFQTDDYEDRADERGYRLQ